MAKRSSAPRKRRERYPVWVERGRSAIVCSGFVMFLVSIALLADVTTKGSNGIGSQMTGDFYRWYSAKRGGPVGLKPDHMVYCLVSLHLLNALFLVVLNWIGGRTAFRAALKVAAALVGMWGFATVLLLAWYKQPVLAGGYALAYFGPLLFIMVAMVAGRKPKEAEAPPVEEEVEAAPTPEAAKQTEIPEDLARFAADAHSEGDHDHARFAAGQFEAIDDEIEELP